MRRLRRLPDLVKPGRAMWVGMGARCRDVAEVRRRYPGCRLVETFSGGRVVEGACSRRRE